MGRVLLVGNGGSLKEKNISDIIDSFDIVCRFNFGGSKVSMDKNRKYIGTKKNIWFNFSFSNILPNRNNLTIFDKNVTKNSYNIDYLHSYDKIYVSGIDWSYITSQSKELWATTNSIENYLDLTSDQFEFIRKETNNKILNLNEVIDTFISNICIFPINYSDEIRNNINELYENVPTTGIKAIYFLLKEYDKLYLCGFDGFKSSHFYGDDEHNDVVKLGYENDEGHSGKREMEYIKKLEKENKIEFIA